MSQLEVDSLAPCQLAAQQAADPKLATMYACKMAAMQAGHNDTSAWSQVENKDAATKEYWTRWPCSRCGTVCSFGSGCLPPPLSSSCSCWFRPRCEMTSSDGATMGPPMAISESPRLRIRWLGAPTGIGGGKPFDGSSDSARSAPGTIAGLLRNRAIFNYSSPDRHGNGYRSTSRDPIRLLGILARFILAVVDHITKWAEACPLPNKEATMVVRALVEQVFFRHEMPVQILSDQGNEVDSSLMREICRSYGIDKVRTTAYNPSTNGAVERFHRSLNSMLGKVVSDSQRDWVERLPSWPRTVPRAMRPLASLQTFWCSVVRCGRRSTWVSEVRAIQSQTTVRTSSSGRSVCFARRTPSCGDTWASRRSDAKEAMTCVSDQHPLPSVPGSGITARVGTSAVLRSGSGTIPGHFFVIAVLGLVDVVIQRSARARPLVVHVDKVKSFLGDPPPSWVADEMATIARRRLVARAESTTDSFQSADEPDTDRMPVDTGFGDDSPEAVGLLAASPAGSSLSPSAPVFIFRRRRHGLSVPPADPPPTSPVGLWRSARERRLPARFRT